MPTDPMPPLPNPSQCLHRLDQYVANENLRLFHKGGVEMRNPMETGLRCIDIVPVSAPPVPNTIGGGSMD